MSAKSTSINKGKKELNTLRDKSKSDLFGVIHDIKKDIFGRKLSSTKDNSLRGNVVFNKKLLRRKIARIYTILRERELKGITGN